MNSVQEILIEAVSRGGFLRDYEVSTLANLDRLRPLLVRCGACRLTCAAQDIDHIEKCIVAGFDYIRDVSLPVSDAAWSGNYQPISPPRETPQRVILAEGRPGTFASDGPRAVASFSRVDYGDGPSDADPGL